MRIIFLKDCPGQGRKGEVKDISDGYAKNFLIPKGFAVLATPSLVSKLENEKRAQAEKERRILEEHAKLKDELDRRTFTIAVKTGDKDQIYGSVHEKDVSAAIKGKTGYEFEKNQIVLPGHIKELGEYTIEIRLAGNIIARPKIKLIKI